MATPCPVEDMMRDQDSHNNSSRYQRQHTWVSMPRRRQGYQIQPCYAPYSRHRPSIPPCTVVTEGSGLCPVSEPNSCSGVFAYDTSIAALRVFPPRRHPSGSSVRLRQSVQKTTLRSYGCAVDLMTVELSSTIPAADTVPRCAYIRLDAYQHRLTYCTNKWYE